MHPLRYVVRGAVGDGSALAHLVGKPSLSNGEVVEILKDTAWLPPGVTAPDPQWGYGRVDAAAAVFRANPLMLAIEKWLHESEWRKTLWLARMAEWVIPKLGPQIGVIEYEPGDRSRIEGWSEEDPVPG